VALRVVRSKGEVGDDKLVGDAERIYLSDSERDVPPRFVYDAARHRNLFVAYDAEEPVGLLALLALFERPFVGLIVVRKEWRRKGIASQLLDTVENAIAPDRLFISTNESNVAMLALLENRGYLRRGMVDGFDSDDPEVFLSLR
jgi:GNAT superfamily N-acetyltransferase